MSNKLIIAGAGSGKTTHIVERALELENRKILITTYTQANEAEIKKRFIIKYGCTPANVTIQTWFSFLLQHGVRPYQGYRYGDSISGLFLVPGQSAIGIAETDTERHYLTPDHKIYSDKIAKFAIKCNELSNGLVVKRLSALYDCVFVDEVQDISGYDLDFLKLLLDGDIEVLLVGDPRQGTYSTNNSQRNRQFRRAQTVDFFHDQSINIETDDTTLSTNHRCQSDICDISNKLFPELSSVSCGATYQDSHQGLFVVRSSDIAIYMNRYDVMQLIYNSCNKTADLERPFMNFGVSKGMEFDRVLIYPTKPILQWLSNQTSSSLPPVSRAKLYVALTRARKSVAIMSDVASVPSGFTIWNDQ